MIRDINHLNKKYSIQRVAHHTGLRSSASANYCAGYRRLLMQVGCRLTKLTSVLGPYHYYIQ
jgi:hypothetical protein